jgi:tRNA threonylcarbamoyl adenosine modification protein (Sua5/YciO/YrdC/YwlC family)
MLIQIHPENPSQRQILKVVEILRKGGVIIYPTDTVYGLGCDIFNNKAVERVARIKGIRPEKSNFSIICHDLSHLSDFARHIDNSTFKLLRNYLPGPYTFIVEASNKLPKIFKNKKKTIGIRIPKHNIPLEIVRELGNPILTTSIHDGDKIIEYTTDPELIHENLMNLVDLVIDGGYGHNIPSTIIDCTGESPVVVRKGLGHFEG